MFSGTDQVVRRGGHANIQVLQWVLERIAHHARSLLSRSVISILRRNIPGHRLQMHKLIGMFLALGCHLAIESFDALLLFFGHE